MRNDSGEILVLFLSTLRGFRIGVEEEEEEEEEGAPHFTFPLTCFAITYFEYFIRAKQQER